MGCLHAFWCCRNKWSKMAPYSSWIRCISFMCSATFSIPFKASAQQMHANKFSNLTQKFYQWAHNVQSITYRLNGHALHIGDPLNFAIVAIIMDISISFESALSNTIPMYCCAVVLDFEPPKIPEVLDCLRLLKVKSTHSKMKISRGHSELNETVAPVSGAHAESARQTFRFHKKWT